MIIYVAIISAMALIYLQNFVKINLCKWFFEKLDDDKLSKITKFYNIPKNL